MKRLIAKLAVTGTWLLAGTAYAADPGFDGIDVISGTTGTLSGCPAGSTSCNILIEGEGFLQQEVIINGSGTNTQTVIIDPLAGSAQDDVMVAWRGQRVGLDGLGESTFGFISTDELAAQLAHFRQHNTTVTSTGPYTIIEPNMFTQPDDVTVSGIEDYPVITEQPGSFGPFKPGRHLLTWQAPLLDNSEPQLWAQILNVLPLVSFDSATTISANEGSRVTIPVYLNGDAPSYPVRIPFTVSGTATYPDDHDAVDGEIYISTGKTGTITFNIANDEIPDEASEDIVITLQQPNDNRSAPGHYITKRILLTDAHLPPQLDMAITQGNIRTRFIDNNTSSNTTATVVIRANNSAHHYLIDWSDSDNTILSAATNINEKTLSFNAAGLPSGSYNIKAKIVDLLAAGEPSYSVDTLINVSDVIAPALIEVDETTQHTHTFDNGVTLHWPALPDSEGLDYEHALIDIQQTFSTPSSNVITDPFVWEPVNFGDAPTLDGANLPTPEIPNSLPSFIAITTTSSPITEILPEAPPATVTSPHVTTGLTLRSGGITIASGKSGNSITLDDLRTHGGPNGGPALYPVDGDLVPDQIVDFEIAGLTTPGQSVDIVIPQENPIPANPLYRKYMPHAGWVAFTEDDNNSLASTHKVNDICPAPEDTAYVDGLSEGHNCIRLTLEDGGPNDADQQANSIIKDPGGVTAGGAKPVSGEDVNGNEASGGGGSGLSLLWLLFALSAVRACHLARGIRH